MKVGDVYHVVFLDHVMGDSIPCECEVFGRVVSETPDHVTIGSWLIVGDLEDSNREIFCIIKSTIKRIKKLK